MVQRFVREVEKKLDREPEDDVHSHLLSAFPDAAIGFYLGLGDHLTLKQICGSLEKAFLTPKSRKD